MGEAIPKRGQLLQAGKDLTLTFAYDARNRLIQIQDSTGARVTYGYDARGNRLKAGAGNRGRKKGTGRGSGRRLPGGKTDKLCLRPSLPAGEKEGAAGQRYCGGKEGMGRNRLCL